MTKSKNRLFAELVSDDGSGSTQLAKVNAAFAPSATPEVTIVNSTHEDTDGGREGKLKFQGEQSGGELSTLAEIQGSHDGTADDQKGDLIFKTNDGDDGTSPTERMRIDSAGAVKLEAGNLQIKTTGQIEDNGTRLLCRSTGDASGLRFDGGGYTPFKNGSVADGTVDLGYSSGRYKDLYLGGGAYIGGTGSANYLDDYEEGTFNFEMVGYHGSPSPKIEIPAQYTKIGNTVHFWALKTAMNTTSYSGNMWFSGLPFSSPAPYSSLGGIYLSHIGTYSGYGPFLFMSGTIAYALLHQSNASSWSAVMHNVVTSGGEVYIAGSYKV